MLYTIIDIYEVMRTDEIYPQIPDNTENYKTQENDAVCTDPYRFLHII